MSDILKSLSETIGKVAPLLGSAIAGPLGGAVSALIASSLGSKSVDPKDLLAIISNDSESTVKLKQIEMEYQVALLSSQSTNFKTEVDDRKDARSHFSHTWQQFLLASLYIIFFSIIIIMNGTGMMHLDERLIGVLEAAMMTILYYYFGASYRPSLKDK